ncbi:hypothetical protein SNEBB_000786 [Seison nebaliae]|nr:hypothetical protein SNEBB_000786 [Seison nebaliae]
MYSEDYDDNSCDLDDDVRHNGDEINVPRAAVNKVVKEIEPNLRLSGEARDLVVTCCNEFIRTLSRQANEICEEQNKHVMIGEHIILALDRLGFSEYKLKCNQALSATQDEFSRRRRDRDRSKIGLTEEELIEKQNELFDLTRSMAPSESTSDVSTSTTVETVVITTSSTATTTTNATTGHKITLDYLRTMSDQLGTKHGTTGGEVPIRPKLSRRNTNDIFPNDHILDRNKNKERIFNTNCSCEKTHKKMSRADDDSDNYD